MIRHRRPYVLSEDRKRLLVRFRNVFLGDAELANLEGYDLMDKIGYMNEESEARIRAILERFETPEEKAAEERAKAEEIHRRNEQLRALGINPDEPIEDEEEPDIFEPDPDDDSSEYSDTDNEIAEGSDNIVEEDSRNFSGVSHDEEETDDNDVEEDMEVMDEELEVKRLPMRDLTHNFKYNRNNTQQRQ